MLRQAAEKAQSMAKEEGAKLIQEAAEYLDKTAQGLNVEEAVKNAISQVSKAVGKLPEDLSKGIEEVVSAVEGAIQRMQLDSLGNGLEKLLDGLEGDAKAAATKLIEQIQNADSDKAAAELLKQLGNVLKEAGADSDIVETITEEAVKLAKGDASGLEELVKECGLENLEKVLTEAIGKEKAEEIVEAIESLLSGDKSLEELMEGGVNKLLDELPAGTGDALKEVLTAISEGESVEDILETFKDLGENAARDGVAGLLGKTGLPKEAQQTIMEGLEKAANGDWTGIWEDAKGDMASYLGDKVAEKFGEEAGAAVKNAITEALNGDEGWLDSATDAGATILSSVLEQKLGGLLDSLAAKYPILGEIFNALGIDGPGLMSGIGNIWNAIKDGELAELFSSLMNDIAEALRNLAEKLKNFAQDFLDNLMNVVTDFISGLINDLVDMLKSAVTAALDEFLKMLQELQAKVASASSYFLGAEKGMESKLMEMKNSLKDALQKNVFKSQSAN